MRTGKIARLPAVLREEVDRRLNDRQNGPEVLGWLNALPEVRAVLDTQFGGRPVSSQNLSYWRQGGHQDWQEERQVQAVAKNVTGMVMRHADADGGNGLATGMAATLGMVLAQNTRKLCDASASIKERVEMVELATRGLTTLRWAISKQELERLSKQACEIEREKARLERTRFEALKRTVLNALTAGPLESPADPPTASQEAPAPGANPGLRGEAGEGR